MDDFRFFVTISQKSIVPWEIASWWCLGCRILLLSVLCHIVALFLSPCVHAGQEDSKSNVMMPPNIKSEEYTRFRNTCWIVMPGEFLSWQFAFIQTSSIPPQTGCGNPNGQIIALLQPELLSLYFWGKNTSGIRQFFLQEQKHTSVILFKSETQQ